MAHISGADAEVSELMVGSKSNPRRFSNFKSKFKNDPNKFTEEFLKRIDINHAYSTDLLSIISMIRDLSSMEPKKDPLCYFKVFENYPTNIIQGMHDRFEWAVSLPIILKNAFEETQFHSLRKAIYDMAFNVAVQILGSDGENYYAVIYESESDNFAALKKLIETKSPERMLRLLEEMAAANLINLMIMYSQDAKSLNQVQYMFKEMLFSEHTATKIFLDSIKELAGIRVEKMIWGSKHHLHSGQYDQWERENERFGDSIECIARCLFDGSGLSEDDKLRIEIKGIPIEATMTGWKIMRICSWLRKEYPNVIETQRERLNIEVS